MEPRERDWHQPGSGVLSEMACFRQLASKRYNPEFVAMRVTYQLTESDFLEAQSRHSGVWLKLLRIWGILLIAAALISATRYPQQYSNYVLPLLLGLFFLFGLRMLARRSFRRDQRLKQHFEAVVSESGIAISSPTASTNNRWTAFSRYVESRNLFLLYQAPQVFNVLPKRAFAEGETEAFRALLQEKLGVASAAHRKKISPRVVVFLVVVAGSLVLLVMAIRNIH